MPAPQQIAKFMINDMRGIMKRENISFDEFSFIIKPGFVAMLLGLEDNGGWTRQQTRKMIVQTIREERLSPSPRTADGDYDNGPDAVNNFLDFMAQKVKERYCQLEQQ